MFYPPLHHYCSDNSHQQCKHVRRSTEPNFLSPACSHIVRIIIIVVQQNQIFAFICLRSRNSKILCMLVKSRVDMPVTCINQQLSGRHQITSPTKTSSDFCFHFWVCLHFLSCLQFFRLSSYLFSSFLGLP